MEYIRKQAQDYDYGAHLIHDREAEEPGKALSLKGNKIDLIKQTKYTKYAAAAAVYAFVAAGIVIDILLIYLTRGRNLKGRVLKLSKKVKQVIKFLDDNNLELYPPSIAINAGMYYYMNSSRRMSLVYEANIKAEPLVAVGYKQNFDLVKDFLKGDPDKSKQAIVADLEENGTFSIKATVEAEGACKSPFL